MIKITLKIDGMSCSMCESHVNDVIRRNFSVKKVTSSHKKGKAEIITKNEIDEDMLKKAIGENGYEVLSVKSETYDRTEFSLFRK